MISERFRGGAHALDEGRRVGRGVLGDVVGCLLEVAPAGIDDFLVGDDPALVDRLAAVLDLLEPVEMVLDLFDIEPGRSPYLAPYPATGSNDDTMSRFAVPCAPAGLPGGPALVR